MNQPGQYIEILDEELKALEAEANRHVEIQEFVPVNTLGPEFFKKTYHLGPDKGGEKPYCLLAQAMANEGQAGSCCISCITATKCGICRDTRKGKRNPKASK